jgi:MFS family permease
MLVQSAFFAAYFLVSIPAAKIVQRIGYMRAAVVGLISMAMGCLLFIPASNSGLFIARTPRRCELPLIPYFFALNCVRNRKLGALADDCGRFCTNIL